MSSWRGHLKGAGLLWVVMISLMLYFEVDLNPWIPASFTFFVATLLPDVDTPASKIRRYVEMTLLLLIGYSIIYGSLVLGVALVALMLFIWCVKHRGVFHKYYAAFLLSSAVMYFSLYHGLMFLAGYTTHIFIDEVKKK